MQVLLRALPAVRMFARATDPEQREIARLASAELGRQASDWRRVTFPPGALSPEKLSELKEGTLNPARTSASDIYVEVTRLDRARLLALGARDIPEHNPVLYEKLNETDWAELMAFGSADRR